MRLVIALGGNALVRRGQRGTIREQVENAMRAARAVAEVVEEGHEVVLTHGNGPQVGDILEMAEMVSDEIPRVQMDVAVAMTQGWIGYLLQQAISNEFRRRGIEMGIVTLVTRTLVDRNDPEFLSPTKFVGPYYDRERALRVSKERGWIMKKDPRGGWRRVVPSPDPKGQLEVEAIRRLIESNFLVIASGGGGIPVVEEDGELVGVEAVVDKDLAAAILALSLNADFFISLTDVEGAKLNFGGPREELIGRVSVEEIERYYLEGHFSPGSMGPKVLACIRFIRGGGRRAAIGHLDDALNVIKGRKGTQISP